MAGMLVAALACSSASGAMRNLLHEFNSAIYSVNLNKVDALIKEGLYVNDAVAPTVDLALSVSVFGTAAE